jgi:hypothetical protein
MVVNKITKSKDGRKAHLTYHDTKKRGGFAIYLDKMPDFMSVEIVESIELDEKLGWHNDVLAKFSQIIHPGKWKLASRIYIKLLSKGDYARDASYYKKHPSVAASEIEKATNGKIKARQFRVYINNPRN